MADLGARRIEREPLYRVCVNCRRAIGHVGMTLPKRFMQDTLNLLSYDLDTKRSGDMAYT